MDLIVYIPIDCPWCGESYETAVDTSQEDFETIEDCTVCCRPIQLSVQCEPGEVLSWDSSRG